MPNDASIVQANIYFIEQGIDLLHELDEDLYHKKIGPFNKSEIGRHFRHVIEHYQSLLSRSEFLIDYDGRSRDKKLETNRLFMIETMEKVIIALNEFLKNPTELDSSVQIRSNEGDSEDYTTMSSSTIRREFQFLISHTVHHYALIGLILKTMGFQPPEDFGVAPSTLNYESQQNAS